ncbi:hypothetical protein GCM10007878_11680 [Marinospirillum insulare]|uniref:Uncharacterized protein n=1 Tax=Marinospirillum insulare TaxID=217169 RepID=A0ABQ5ZXC4_9GAMM|nr:hypothetical protein GCM10007878_11680 [Marinospirillum insulare]
MKEPMSIAQIHIKIKELTGLEVDRTITSLLVNQGYIYNTLSKTWFK